MAQRLLNRYLFRCVKVAKKWLSSLKLLIPANVAVSGMNVTTVPCGSETRDALADYRDKNEFPNYDSALRDLLDVEVARE